MSEPCFQSATELYAALDCAVVGAVHPFYTSAIRVFERAGRPVVGSGRLPGLSDERLSAAAPHPHGGAWIGEKSELPIRYWYSEPRLV